MIFYELKTWKLRTHSYKKIRNINKKYVKKKNVMKMVKKRAELKFQFIFFQPFAWHFSSCVLIFSHTIDIEESAIKIIRFLYLSILNIAGLKYNKVAQMIYRRLLFLRIRSPGDDVAFAAQPFRPPNPKLLKIAGRWSSRKIKMLDPTLERVYKLPWVLEIAIFGEAINVS